MNHTHRSTSPICKHIFGLFCALSTAFLFFAAFNPVYAADDAENAAPQKVLIEIYRIAPGKHEKFLKSIASFDEANIRAGLPPRQLYVHSDGANWDFLLIQPASTPADKAEALDKAWEDLGLPSGAKFFLTFRENILDHSDTFAKGPTTAAAFLASVD